LVRHWFYKEGKQSRARPFVDRMEVVLLALGPNEDSMHVQEGWALVHEVRGDLREAARYREKEITQWERFFRALEEDTRPKEERPDWSSDHKHAADSYVRTAMLYEKLGELEKAYEHLEKGERHARKYGLAFPHEDFRGRLRKAIQEAKAGGTPAASGSPPPLRRRRSAPILDEAEIAEMRRRDAIPYGEAPETPLWWELDELVSEIVDWQIKEEMSRARPFADQLEKVLLALPPDENSRAIQEAWALVHETRGDLRKAVEYREKEIALCEKWVRIMGPPDREGYEARLGDDESVAGKHLLTAYLYDDLGELEKAYAHVKKALRLARKHGFELYDDREGYLLGLRWRIHAQKA
jgi:tetratricopeptide (TPR) repeat protein